MNAFETAAVIRRERLVGIIRTGDVRSAVQAGRALLDGGLRVVEVALTTPGGLDAVRELAAGHPEAVVGAGTVLDGAAAQDAVRAGARFLVSPTFMPEVVELCQHLDVAAMPGAYTPTEMLAAHAAGAEFVKLFPASSLGPEYLRAVRAALPQLSVVPTGGIDPEDVAIWLEAGAAAVGLGGKLTAGEPDEIRRRAEDLGSRLQR